VAVGIVYHYELEHGGDIPEPTDLRSFLASLDNAEPIELVLEAAEDDKALRERLERRAAFSGAGGGQSLDGLLAAVDDALVLNGNYQLDFDEHEHYAEAVGDFAAQVPALAAADRADDTVALARRATDRVRQNWQQAEVSYRDGETAGELATAHLDACLAAPADPIETADWIATHQLDDNTMPELDIADYEAVLGEEGLARYGSLLQSRKGRAESWTYWYLLIRYAECTGDDELLLETRAQSAAEHGNVWPLVEQLDRMGRRAEAVNQTMEGLAAGRPDQRLVDFLAEHYTAAGDRESLVALHRDRFEGQPGLHSYEALVSLNEPEHLEWAVEKLLDLLKSLCPGSAWPTTWPRSCSGRTASPRPGRPPSGTTHCPKCASRSPSATVSRTLKRPERCSRTGHSP